jgi:hypothetical protein
MLGLKRHRDKGRIRDGETNGERQKERDRRRDTEGEETEGER